MRLNGWQQRYRTELSESGLLYSAVGGVTADPEVQDVWVWTLDEGPGVVAYGRSCLRFPEDGSAPDSPRAEAGRRSRGRLAAWSTRTWEPPA